ncbi:MAG: hypothetical protein IPM98_15705 [Lewinellaceae bacterium]|nr:hypothetical protein [Lewinellaceae bacterium]
MLFLLLPGAFCLPLAAQNIPRPNIRGANGVEVNTYTGSLFLQRQDLFIPGRGLSIDLTFSYNSSARDRDWGFGRGWTHNYNMLYYTDSVGAVTVLQMDGRKNRYTPNGFGGFNPPIGVFDHLEQYEPGKFRLRRLDGTRYFF